MPKTKPNVIFSNPEKKPLEELVLIVVEDGVNIKVPALDKRWAQRDVFTPYLPLVLSGGKLKTDADLDEWIYETEWFLKEMMFLLEMRHYRFWSYMIYQDGAMASVLSFLKNATPFYIDTSSLPTDKRVLILYLDVLSAVVRVICRMITNKESDEEWITKDKLKDLIYSNFLISIPMLFDLIVALGRSNTNLLRKIFDTVVRIEPKYRDDLTVGLKFLMSTFDTIQVQVENEGALGEENGNNENLDTPYDDLVLFTLDTLFTLSILLDIFPDARKICCDINLGQRLTLFYDSTIPVIYKNIYLINANASSLKYVNEARIQLLKAFRSIVYLHIENVLSDPENSLAPSEEFIAIMTECLSDRAFVIDYQPEYPIELDIDILKQACKDLDTFKTDFIAKGYKDEADSETLGTIESMEKLAIDEPEASSLISSMSERPQPEGAAAATQIDYDDDQPSTSRAARSSTATTNPANETNTEANDRDIDLEVTSVLEVLPHLGDGFIRRVLSRYDNSEEAIAAILEQNLPPDLIHADQSEVYIPIDPQDILYQQTGIKRFNIFDGDKYDVMTQDNPDCIIKIGKGFPNAPQSLNEMLDDKTELNAVRHRFQEYSLVEEGNVYDDEYDDSYDALLESESRVVKSKQIKSTLAEIGDSSDDDEEEEVVAAEEEEEEEEKEQQQKDKKQQSNDTTKTNYDKYMNFCENPEDVRARYEARRAAKFGGGNNSAKAPPPQFPRDVVGEAKGKGQSKEVVINRHKKDVNKSSRANHNRKAGAAFKRSKGMMG
ncbi:activating signal cointegrator 1 complex subunit 2 [Eupeodes corollae]|uniref:activating signal cointegrator 1 complex subunit 2 n=1 Tax=Eupeodes corollae TaxID=290404 RepID=UPI0024901A2E|nr:activating signal cointegrator 1 complex subunit 2 [Eupeodes corollae]